MNDGLTAITIFGGFGILLLLIFNNVNNYIIFAEFTTWLLCSGVAITYSWTSHGVIRS